MQAAPVLDRDGEPTGEYQYQGQAANRALELLGKELGMFVERKQVDIPGQLAQLSDAQIAALFAEVASGEESEEEWVAKHATPH